MGDVLLECGSFGGCGCYMSCKGMVLVVDMLMVGGVWVMKLFKRYVRM